MKNVFILLFLTFNLYAQNIELNLKQFAELVSSQHRVNIIIDDSIEVNKFSFYVQRHKNKILLAAFKKMLYLKKLKLHYDKKNNFYYIDFVKPPKEIEKNLYSIKLNTLIYDDIKLILDNFPDLKYSYIKNTNSIVLICTNKVYQELKNIVSSQDVVPKQFQLKITVIETNLDDVKDRGIEINSYVQDSTLDVGYFINLITMSSASSVNTFNNSKLNVLSSLRFLDDLGVSSIEASPFVTVQSGKQIYFSAVENVPYLTSSSSVSGASQSETQQVSYKDVGLKITLTPKQINETIFIDLKFTIESFLDKSSLTPQTAKRELNNSFQLKRGQLLVLSGFKKQEKSKSTLGIPVLMAIPYLGQMFRYDRDISTNKSLSITIEVI